MDGNHNDVSKVYTSLHSMHPTFSIMSHEHYNQQNTDFMNLLLPLTPTQESYSSPLKQSSKPKDMFHLCLLQIENRTAPCPLFSAYFAPPESIGCTSPSRPSHLLLTAIDTYRSFNDSLTNPVQSVT